MSNMVFTFDFQRTVNIAHVAAAFHGSRPPKFPAAIVALSTPVVTLIFFSTGQVVLSGARSEGDAAIAAWMAAVKMTTLTGNEHYVHNLRVQNVVGTCALGFPIDCGLLDRDFQMYTLHKPARISHVKFKAWAERRVMLVYPSGKLVVSGVKHPDQLRAISTSFDFRPYNANKPYRQLEPEYRKSSVRTAGKGETKSKSKAKAASRPASAK
jgi:transcription initiation factor TFIID TATA-box-binding protein